MAKQVVISIIIPHYNGKSILADCLNSIAKNSYRAYEVIVVDNGSTDGSPEMLRNTFKWVHLIENKDNLGFAGGCNMGMQVALGTFFLLLNNDTILSENTLEALLRKMNDDDRIGLVQPKIRSMQQNILFDYSGGAGGEIDIFGYPFTRGRLFDKIESDQGQYDGGDYRIFWASGTCCLVRREIIEKLGGLDESFFAHMEEIDLNWRAHLAGYFSVVTGNTFIYHYSGYTLKATHHKKMYLNHRNNMMMLIKNYSLKTLVWILPLRSCLEVINLVYALITGNLKWALAIVRSMVYLLCHIPHLVHKHNRIQKLRTTEDRVIRRSMYKPSIVWAYFILRKKSMDLIIKMDKI
jgi:GT2 family glycosyltransferase